MQRFLQVFELVFQWVAATRAGQPMRQSGSVDLGHEVYRYEIDVSLAPAGTPPDHEDPLMLIAAVLGFLAEPQGTFTNTFSLGGGATMMLVTITLTPVSAGAPVKE